MTPPKVRFEMMLVSALLVLMMALFIVPLGGRPW